VHAAVHVRPLQNALNAAAWLVLHKRKFDHITADVRDHLHWLPHQAAGGVQGQFTDQQVSPSSSSIMSGWDVRSRLSNRQPMSPPLCNTRRRGSSTSQTDKIRKSVSGPLLWNSLPLTVCDVWLTLTQFCAWLKTFCFLEPTGHRHSASVTVSGVKFVCANTNLLTYLLAAVWCAYSVKNAMQLCGLRDWSN